MKRFSSSSARDVLNAALKSGSTFNAIKEKTLGLKPVSQEASSSQSSTSSLSEEDLSSRNSSMKSSSVKPKPKVLFDVESESEHSSTNSVSSFTNSTTENNSKLSKFAKN